MYEDAKLSKKNICTTYSEFKWAFGEMDHIILFQLMKEYGFHDSYINTCQQLYAASNTYYITIHGNTLPIPIERGTLQGDTLSPYIPFNDIYGTPPKMARRRKSGLPLLLPTTYDHLCHHHIRRPRLRSRCQHYVRHNTKSKNKLKKLHFFSQYTGLQLETTKQAVFWPGGQESSGRSLRQTEDGWYPSRKRRFSFLGSPAKR